MSGRWYKWAQTPLLGLALLLLVAEAGATGVRIVEPFVARLAGGGEIRLAPGADYPLLGMDAGQCRIAYSPAPGITLEVTVPRSRVRMVEPAGAEVAEPADRPGPVAAAAPPAGKAKGRVAVGEAWMTAEQEAAIKAVQQLAVAAPWLEGRRRTAAEREQERVADEAERTSLIADLAAQEELLNQCQRQLAQDKTTLNRAKPQQVARYNANVMDFNRRAGKYAQTLKQQQTARAKYPEKLAAYAAARDAYVLDEQAFAAAAKAAREQFLTATQHADGRQWAVLRPYGLWLAQIIDAALGPNGPGQAMSQGGWVTAKVNHELTLRFLVDTGASYVTLSDTQFLHLGVPLPPAAPAAVLRLANGEEIRGRRVTLRSVRIGTLEVTEVTAVVLPDHPGFVPLLGMSFLNRCRWRCGASGDLLFDAP